PIAVRERIGRTGDRFLSGRSWIDQNCGPSAPSPTSGHRAGLHTSGHAQAEANEPRPPSNSGYDRVKVVQLWRCARVLPASEELHMKLSGGARLSRLEGVTIKRV